MGKFIMEDTHRPASGPVHHHIRYKDRLSGLFFNVYTQSIFSSLSLKIEKIFAYLRMHSKCSFEYSNWKQMQRLTEKKKKKKSHLQSWQEFISDAGLFNIGKTNINSPLKVSLSRWSNQARDLAFLILKYPIN